MDFDLICSRYLGNQDWAPRLKDIVHTTGQYVAGHYPTGSGSRRKADLQTGARHAQGLRTSFDKIDLMYLAEAMGPLRGEEIVPGPSAAEPGEIQASPAEATDMENVRQSFVPLRLAELGRFRTTLNGVSTALNARADTVPVRHKRPPLPDPVLFGVEALRALWRAAHGHSPTYSFNQGQFGDFALTVLGPDGLGIKASVIHSAVRKALTGSGKPEAVSPEPD